MFRQKLLVVWANYWWHHVLSVVGKGVLAVVLISGVTAPVVVTTHPLSRHKTVTPVAVQNVAATNPKPAATNKPAPAPQPAPAPVAASQTPAAKPAAPTPVQVAASAPAPASPAKGLVSAPAPAISPDPSGASPPAPTTPSQPDQPATGGYYSSNWAGYVATTGSYSAVSGSWTVPSVTGNGTAESGDSSWIGIGGVFDTSLIQTGTGNMVYADGHTETYVFYELLPDPAMLIIGMTVSAGDSMSANIHETSLNHWLITISNNTTGQTFSKSVIYTSSHSSAEWIEEDPSYLDGSLVPFDDFGITRFTGATATSNGATATIAVLGGKPITLLNQSGTAIAVPSVLNAAGSGFSVTKK